MRSTHLPSSKDVSVTIARRLREVRTRGHVTQATLAERIEVSTELISRIERGITLPSVETLVRLCVVLGCTPNELLLDEVAASDPLLGIVERLRVAPKSVVDNVVYLAEAALEFGARSPSAPRAQPKKKTTKRRSPS